MWEVLKVNVHPACPDHLVITDEIEDLDINDINGITTAPIIQRNRWPNISPHT
jgi:hypothetical protein